jgi:hypothetical protein
LPSRLLPGSGGEDDKKGDGDNNVHNYGFLSFSVADIICDSDNKKRRNNYSRWSMPCFFVNPKEKKWGVNNIMMIDDR